LGRRGRAAIPVTLILGVHSAARRLGVYLGV